MIVRFNIHTFEDEMKLVGDLWSKRVKAMRDITITREWPSIPRVGDDVRLSCMAQPEKVTAVRYDDDGIPTVLISAKDSSVVRTTAPGVFPSETS